MLILPAIDLKDNKCVRLTQGDFNRIKEYSAEPLAVALKWQEEGAAYLHLVDLDGARSGTFLNRPSIEAIVKNIKIPVQIGGGIRDEKKVKAFLDLGVARVILGTVAVRDRALLERLLADYGSDKIIVSIDAKDGKVATEGWAQVSALDALNLCQQLEKSGVKTIVYTDIAKDGMLHGPNFQIYEELMEKTELALIASGGITSLEDVRRLQSMQVYGAIIGKAFYDQKLNFKEVLACLQ